MRSSLYFPGEVVIFTEKEEETLMHYLEVQSSSSIYDRLKKLFTTNGWVEESQLVDALEAPLMRLCAYYLVVEKRRGYALNSVGKHFLFDLGNNFYYNFHGENFSSYNYYNYNCIMNIKSGLPTVILPFQTVLHSS